MTTATLTRTDFLLARIAEDEAAAREAAADSPAPWVVHQVPDQQIAWIAAADKSVVLYDERGPEHRFDVVPLHVARWDPARVLAECEAKRRLIERYREARMAAESIRDTFAGDDSPRARSERTSYGATESAWWSVMATLALPYADHPDYDESWRA